MSLILVVDDDQDQRNMLQRILKKEGYEVDEAENGAIALEKYNRCKADLILADMRMPQMDGAQLLREVKQLDPDIPVIIVTAYGEVEDAVELVTHQGAFYYLEKPIVGDKMDKLKHEIKRALQSVETVRENKKLAEEISKLKARFDFKNIVGNSSKMQHLFRTLVKAIHADPATVLIAGESGTGKDLVAQAIHYSSRRKDGPFMMVGCAAIPESLLESELFGHEKWAFTDAKTRRYGKFEAAHTGTIFLDEIGEISPTVQVKLLRVIEERQFERVGSNDPVKVDVRIIAATNRDLEEEVKNKRFREDLYYRLNVLLIHMPPLRDRKDDIPLLIEHFLKKSAEKIGVSPKKLSSKALSALSKYDWPGNVRQLENYIERAFIMSEDDTIELQDLPAEVYDYSLKPTEIPIEFPDEGISLEQLNKELIKKALQLAGGVQTEAARLLGLTRRTLQYRMDKYGIPSKGFKAD